MASDRRIETCTRVLSLRRCWEDWYALDGGGNWASVEGTADEWREVVKALRHELPSEGQGKGYGVHFKRLGCRLYNSGWQLYSPRNMVGQSDIVNVHPNEEAEALAAEIERELAVPYASDEGYDDGDD